MSEPIIQLAQAAGTSIGQVHDLDGAATLVRVDGTRVPAAEGTPVFQGDTVVTEAGGSLGIVFADDSTVSLGGDGRMVIDEMVYDPGAQTGSAALNIAKGVFAYVSGQVAKSGPDNMVLKTPVATIGVRGTSLAGRAGEEGSANTITLLPDPDGSIGEAVISNAVGSRVLNQAYQTTQVTSAFSPPPPPVTLPPSVVSRVYGGVTRSLARQPAVESDQQQGTDGEQADPAAAAAEEQAAQAFEDAIAQGASLEDALAVATGTAIENALQQATGLPDTALLPVGPAPSLAQAINQAIQGYLDQAIGGPDNFDFGPDFVGGRPVAGEFGLVGPQGPGPLGNLFVAAPPDAIEAQVHQVIESTIDTLVLRIVASASTTSRSVTISGTETVTLQSGVNDLITGSSGDDVLTLSGVASAGDRFDGGAGTDILKLADGANVIQVLNVEELVLPTSSSTQSINWTSAGSMTLSGGNSPPTAPFNLAGTSTTSGTTDLDQTLTLAFNMTGTNAANSAITLSAGTDTLILANGTNTLAAVTGVEVFTLQGSSSQTNTFTLDPSLAGHTINGAASDDTISVNGLGSDDTVDAGAGTDTLVLHQGATMTDSAFQGVSNFESLNLGSNANFTLTLAANAAAAFTGSTLSIASTLVTGNSISIDASSLSDGLYLSLSNSTAGDAITAGSGADSISTGGGNDTITYKVANLDSSDSVNAGTGSDNLSFSDGGTVADSAFTNLSAFEQMTLANAAYSLSLDTNAETAFGGSALTIDGSAVTASTVTISAFHLSAAVTASLGNNSGANSITTGSGSDSVTTGTGTDVIGTGGGNDTVTIANSALTSADSINAGAGTDILALNGGGTVSDSQFTQLSNFEQITLADAAYTMTLASNTQNAFTSGGVSINANALSGNALNLDASSMSSGLVVLTMTNSTAADSIVGGAGGDTISTGGGSDVLDGRTGVNSLTGGAGSDVFVFDAAGSNANLQHITDINSGSDLDTLRFNVNYLGNGSDSGNYFVLGSALSYIENNAATLNGTDLSSYNFIVNTDSGYASLSAAADAIDGGTTSSAGNQAIVAFYNSTNSRGEIYHDSNIGDTGGSEQLLGSFNAGSGGDVAAALSSSQVSYV